MDARRQQTAGYTLLEMLVAMVISLGLIGSAYRLVHQSWVAHSQTTLNTRGNLELVVLSRRLRAFVRSCPPASWRVDERSFTSGPNRIEQVEDRLILTDEHGSRATRLPTGARTRFAVERHPGLADCVVLTLSWEKRFLRRRDQVQARLVACAGRVDQEGQ